MILACLNHKTLRLEAVTPENQLMLKEALWIDLVTPTKAEESQVEGLLGIDVPTFEEMREIEISSRLYKENGILFMTAAVIARSDTLDPKLDPVTFVLTDKQLITVRYIEPQSFKLFTSQLPKLEPVNHHPTALLMGLLDATVDRLADILELVGQHLDEYSKTIFRTKTDNGNKLNYQSLMQHIGTTGDLNTKVRESLVSFNRLITYFSQTASVKLDNDLSLQLMTLSKDIASLSDHANFLSTKINFLLDATLGMVSIEQNDIIKIFSVAAVIFLPPTLIASIYGMNFSVMPELSWKWGYLFAIGLMLISSWLPYKYFKRQKWL